MYIPPSSAIAIDYMSGGSLDRNICTRYGNERAIPLFVAERGRAFENDLRLPSTWISMLSILARCRLTVVPLVWKSEECQRTHVSHAVLQIYSPDPSCQGLCQKVQRYR